MLLLLLLLHRPLPVAFVQKQRVWVLIQERKVWGGWRGRETIMVIIDIYSCTMEGMNL